MKNSFSEGLFDVLVKRRGELPNYQLVFQTELRIPLGYEKKTGQAIALPLKQFGLLRVFSSVYLLAKRYQILNADKHSPASSARSTKRRVRGMLMSVGVESSH